MNDIEWKEGAVCYANGKQYYPCELSESTLINIAGIPKHIDDLIMYTDFQLNEPKQGDYLPKSELDTEQKYNDAAEEFGLFGFNLYSLSDGFKGFDYHNKLAVSDEYVLNSVDEEVRELEFNQLMAIGKLKRLMNERKSSAVSKVNLDIKRAVKSTINAELDKPVNSELKDGDKYIRTIYGLCGTPVKVDIYRVLDAFPTDSSAMDHAAKKVLCAGLRGHKDKLTDIDNAIESLQAERLLLIQKGDL